MTYNVKWLLDRIAERLEFDATEPDQAFGGTTADPWKRMRDWLNEFYTQLINEVSLECPKSYLEVVHAFTWESGNQNYTLPKEVAWSRSLNLMDVTSGSPGNEILVFPSYRNGGVFWSTKDTLTIPSSTGWPQDKSMEWHYLADAEELVDDAQEVVLVPYRHRHLLVWGAALMAREEVDEGAVPQQWYMKVDRLRENYFLDLSQGKLNFTMPTRIGGSISNATTGATL